MEHIKSLVVRVLNVAVRRYLTRNNVRVIAVAGSIGKTSTTSAIRTVLAQQYRVHRPRTAYNTNKSVHLELFELPFATSTLGWIKMVCAVLWRSFGTASYEVAVIEIGTDHPGELAGFAWLRPDIGVLTAIAPEHMEFFKTIEAVAVEELSISGFCRELVCNANAIDRQLVPVDIAERAVWYGINGEVTAHNYRITAGRSVADFVLPGGRLDALELQVLGIHSLDALMAAALVAVRAGMEPSKIADGLRSIEPVRGRMRRLQGLDDVTIIDDSYNASPEAVRAALDVLGQFDVPQRIAVLGMMNEMGDYSAQAHREVGAYCDPTKLDLVVTIGKDANEYVAAEAEARGCRLQRFGSPYDAGWFVRQQVKAGAAVLFKGSQNGVFAEEAIKPLLAEKADEDQLVRQSDYWMTQKRLQFGRVLQD